MLTIEQLAELEQKHGEVAYFKGKPPKGKTEPRWELVLKVPTRPDYQLFRAQVANPAQKPQAQEILVRKCVVYPAEPGAFDALLQRFVGLGENEEIAAWMLEVMGLKAEEEGK